MARTRGAKNADFAASRQKLLSELADLVVRAPGPHSFRSLAAACEVNVGTLRHYFTDTNTLIREVLFFLNARSNEMLVRAMTQVPESVEESLTSFSASIVMGWRHGLGAIHRLGLVYGLTEEGFGSVYLTQVLEPTLAVAEARLARHVAQGTLPKLDLRRAALAWVSPIVMALLHQDNLAGDHVRPLDVEVFAREHARWCARAFATP
jgi:AcrR family transcriptional regulator